MSLSFTVRVTIGPKGRNVVLDKSNRQIQLDINREPGYISCRVNEVMVTAALQCLLLRIIDSTPRKGLVSIKVSHEGESWNLQITNNRDMEKNCLD